jgi:hypothetical protein
VLCGRVGQSGGVPIGHDFSPEAQSTEHGGGNSAEAKCIEQGFHGCDPPQSVSTDTPVGLRFWLSRTTEIIGFWPEAAYRRFGTDSNQAGVTAGGRREAAHPGRRLQLLIRGPVMIVPIAARACRPAWLWWTYGRVR